MAWLSRSPIRIGLAAPSGRELAPYLNTINVPTTDPHLVDRTLDLLPALGLTRGEIRFGMRADEVIDRATRRFLGESHLGQGYAVINPGGGWESKRWVLRRYGEVARELGHSFQIPSLVTWSGDEEQAWGREIVATSGGFAMLSPKTNLRELRSFLRSATLFVGSDTGPMHLAASVGTPCVVLYGPTTAAASGPLGPRHVAIQAMVQSGRGRKRAANTALLAIDTGMVIAGCQSILQSGELRPSPFQGSCHV